MFRESHSPETHTESSSEKNEKLWKNPKIRTVSFRRHSKYDSAFDAPLRGALSSEGIKLAREAAARWAEKAQGAGAEEIEIYESPSSMPMMQGKGESARQIFPARARITASTYEQAIFGNLAPAHHNDRGEPQSNRRKREDLLGDLMETATDVKAIPAYFKARDKIYGKDVERFWHDYVNDHLEPSVQAALDACGASTSLDLTKHVTKFISGIETADGEDESRTKKKKAVIAVTHGETMESFLHAVDQFRKTQGKEVVNELFTGMIAYNTGFDAHIDANGELYVARDGVDPVKINLAEFNAFLDAEDSEE